jgi:drug/metabolite transporter (DMT)-like permease
MPPAAPVDRAGRSSSRPVEHRGRGIALRIGAVTAFGAMMAALKFGSLHGVGAVELIFYRNLFALPTILAWVMLSGGFATVRTSRPAAHATRAAIGLSAMFLSFIALTLLPLAEATAIGFSTPLFATILSALVLRERVLWHRWAAVAVGFVGVLIVVQPGAGALPPLGAAIALAGACGAAVVVITLRQIGATESATATTFWFTSACILVTAVPMPFVFANHGPNVWLALVLGGIFGGFGQIMMTAGLRYAPVSVLAPFDYLQIVWATGWGYLLFATFPSTGALLGAALIAASGCYVVWRERRMRRDVLPSPSEL